MFGAGAARTCSTPSRDFRKIEARQPLLQGRKRPRGQLRVPGNQRRRRPRIRGAHSSLHHSSQPQPSQQRISPERISRERSPLSISRRHINPHRISRPRHLPTHGLPRLPRQPDELRKLTRHLRARRNNPHPAPGRRTPRPRPHRLQMILTRTRFLRTHWNSIPQPRT